MKIKLLFLIAFTISRAIYAQIPAYVPANGLQGWWPFTGNANDQTANGYNGTVNGATLVQDRFNAPNTAYSFNGMSDFISTNYTGIMGSSQRAVSFWAKTTYSNTMMSAVAWGNNATATRFNCMFNYVASGPTMDSGNGAITYSALTNIYDGNWHHFVYQFSNSVLSQAQIYQDGALVSTVLHAFSPSNNFNTQTGFNVHFGRIVYSAGDLFFNGAIDDIGIWDRVLTNCEIQELYLAAKTAVSFNSSSTTICRGQAITLTASGLNTYTWSTGSNASSINVSPLVSTTYTVSGTNTVTGCSATNSISVIVNDCTGFEESSTVNSGIKIYPNPNNGVFYIETKNETDIFIINSLGQTVGSFAAKEENEHRISVTQFPSGVYLVIGKSKEGNWRQKIIIAK